MPRQSIAAGLVLSAAIASFVLGGLLSQQFNRAKETRAKSGERLQLNTEIGLCLLDALGKLPPGEGEDTRKRLHGLLYKHAMQTHAELERPAGLSHYWQGEGANFLTATAEYYAGNPASASHLDKAPGVRAALEAILAQYKRTPIPPVPAP